MSSGPVVLMEPVERPWLVSWSSVFVGALTTSTVLLVFGLIGLALGAHLLGPSRITLDWKTMGWLSVIFNVCGVFFAFVGGGWVTSRIAGFFRAETAMFHGAIMWVVVVPLLTILAAHGASNYMGGWLGGLSANHPAWADVKEIAPASFNSNTSEPAKAQTYADSNAAKGIRNVALSAVAAILLGLMGAVIGAWMASREPMTLTYWKYRTS